MRDLPDPEVADVQKPLDDQRGDGPQKRGDEPQKPI
jgi:hypothetical protein